MSASDDIQAISVQESRLVFSAFDENTAFKIGTAIKTRAEQLEQSVVIDVRLWDRRLFWFAMPGMTADNEHWVRRKANVVQRFHKSTYRMMLERADSGRLLPPLWGTDPADFVFAGGGFPLSLRGLGCIGAVTVSGLPERQDHELVASTLARVLNIDYAEIALPEEGK